MKVMIIGAVLAVVMVAIAVVIEPVFATIVIAACWAIGLGNPADFFFMALVGLFGIGILDGCLEHLTDHCRWLPVELPTELIMMIQPSAEIGDHLGLKDVRNPVPYFREASDVAPKELSYPKVDPGQVMLRCWSLIGHLVIFNKHSLRLSQESMISSWRLVS